MYGNVPIYVTQRNFCRRNLRASVWNKMPSNLAESCHFAFWRDERRRKAISPAKKIPRMTGKFCKISFRGTLCNLPNHPIIRGIFCPKHVTFTTFIARRISMSCYGASRNQGPGVCDECCVVETVVLIFNQLGQKCGVPGLNYTIRYISGLAIGTRSSARCCQRL